MVAGENQVQFKLGATIDNSLKEAQRQLEAVKKQTEALKREILESGQADERAARSLKELTDQQRLLQKVVDSATGDIRDQEDALLALAAANGKAAAEQEKLQERQRRQASAAQERFDVTSQRVALAGDVGSNLRTVAALAPGGGGGAIADVFDTIEALPRLKEAAKGLPGVLVSAAQTLGPAGLFVGAILAGFALLVKGAQDAAAEMKRALSERLDAEQSIAQEIASGATVGEARARIEQERRELEENRRLLAEFQAERNAQFQAEADAFSDAGARIRDALGTTGGAEFDKNIEEQRQAIAENEATIKAYNDAINENRFAADDAAAAEKDYAASKQDSAGVSRQQGASQQQVQKQVEASLRRGISANQVYGRSAVQAAHQLQSAASSLESTGRSQGAAISKSIFSQLLRGVPLGQLKSDREIAAERAAQQKAVEDLRKAQDEQNKIYVDAFNERINIQLEAFRDEEAALRDHYDQLEDARRNALQDERKALREGNIFAIREIRDDLRFELESIRLDAVRGQREGSIELSNRLVDLASETRLQLGNAAGGGIVVNNTFTSNDSRELQMTMQQQIAKVLR